MPAHRLAVRAVFQIGRFLGRGLLVAIFSSYNAPILSLRSSSPCYEERLAGMSKALTRMPSKGPATRSIARVLRSSPFSETERIQCP